MVMVCLNRIINKLNLEMYLSKQPFKNKCLIRTRTRSILGVETPSKVKLFRALFQNSLWSALTLIFFLTLIKSAKPLEIS